MKKIRRYIKRLERLRGRPLLRLSFITFIIFLVLGLIIGYSINTYRIYKLKNYQEKVEREAKERISRKLEKYRLQIK